MINLHLRIEIDQYFGEFARSVSENVVARFIEPNKLGNYNLTLQYIGLENMTLAFLGQTPRISVFY